MSEGLLTALKICFLALLYLFLFRVVRVVVLELRADRVAAGDAGAPAAAAAASPASKRTKRGGGLKLKIVEPATAAGSTYPLDEEVSLGRAAGCSVVLDDTYVSQVHARISRQRGDIYVEDLGSSNGTFVNQEQIAGPTRLRRGDRLRMGNTVLEVTK